jgi:hypothetical protein
VANKGLSLMRRLLVARLVLLALLALLPLALAGCAGLLPAPQARLAADAPGAEADAPAASAAVWRLGDAAVEFAHYLQGCSAPCLSPAEQEAIIARAIAEHEMRRP